MSEINESYDLHSHSNFSDGELSPTELLALAKDNNVTTLALTDHDTLAGIPEAQQAAKEQQIRLIPGVEVSTSWKTHELHVVGLNVSTERVEFHEFLQNVGKCRIRRAKEIAAALEREGIRDTYDSVCKIAKEDNIIRPHFAQVLVERGIVNDLQEAFDRYLKAGKSCFVPTKWPKLEVVVQQIHQAGGVAVLAHALRYKLTMTKLRLLLEDFKSFGGDGVEVITSTQDARENKTMAELSTEYNLLASKGSDFHGLGNRARIGRLPLMPEQCQPVWTRF